MEVSKTMTENVDEIIIKIPSNLVSSLKKEFNLAEDEVHKFILSALEKIILEKNSAQNSGVFTEAETKEIEEELKGLGYL
jgi:hypothetical protein